MQLSIRNLTIITTRLFRYLRRLVKQFSLQFSVTFVQSLLQRKISVEKQTMRKIGPSSIMKLLDSYPASSKIGLIGSVSMLKFHIVVKIASVSIMSKLVSFIIAIIIFEALRGKLTEKRTVNMIICSVLIRPQRN